MFFKYFSGKPQIQHDRNHVWQSQLSGRLSQQRKAMMIEDSTHSYKFVCEDEVSCIWWWMKSLSSTDTHYENSVRMMQRRSRSKCQHNIALALGACHDSGGTCHASGGHIQDPTNHNISLSLLAQLCVYVCMWNRQSSGTPLLAQNHQFCMQLFNGTSDEVFAPTALYLTSFIDFLITILTEYAAHCFCRICFKFSLHLSLHITKHFNWRCLHRSLVWYYCDNLVDKQLQQQKYHILFWNLLEHSFKIWQNSQVNKYHFMQNYQLFTMIVIYLEVYISGPAFRHTGDIICTYTGYIKNILLH